MLQCSSFRNVQLLLLTVLIVRIIIIHCKARLFRLVHHYVIVRHCMTDFSGVARSFTLYAHGTGTKARILPSTVQLQHPVQLPVGPGLNIKFQGPQRRVYRSQCTSGCAHFGAPEVITWRKKCGNKRSTPTRQLGARVAVFQNERSAVAWFPDAIKRRHLVNAEAEEKVYTGCPGFAYPGGTGKGPTQRKHTCNWGNSLESLDHGILRDKWNA